MDDDPSDTERPRTPSAPAVPHLRASTSAARLRRLGPATGVEVVHGKARHQDIRRGDLSRVQHVRGGRSAAPPPRTEARITGRVPARTTCKQAPTVTVDGKSVPVTEVETPLLNITLPADNIFGAASRGRQGQSVAHGWVTLLHPLTPGTHTIVIVGTGGPPPSRPRSSLSPAFSVRGGASDP